MFVLLVNTYPLDGNLSAGYIVALTILQTTETRGLFLKVPGNYQTC